METIVIDTSVIKRSEELKRSIAFDFLSRLLTASQVIIPVAVKEECIRLGASLEGMQIQEVDYDKSIWNSLHITSDKNLGEAECIKLCYNNKRYIFLTDDYDAWKKGQMFLGERSQYFLFALPYLNFLRPEEKMQILRARNKQRKIAKKVFARIKLEIVKK